MADDNKTTSKDYHKTYYQTNKDKIKDQQMRYRINNRNFILEYHKNYNHDYYQKIKIILKKRTNYTIQK